MATENKQVKDIVLDATLISREQDEQFALVPGLTWYPWVGREYTDCPLKILIVGESHYNYGETQEQVTYYNEETIRDRERTRKVVQYFPVEAISKQVTFENLHRALFGNVNIDRKAVWRKVAFYNFIQRPLTLHTTLTVSNEKKKSVPERPNSQDLSTGWNVFKEVVDLLHPDYCIFIGVAAVNYYARCMSGDVQMLKLAGSSRDYAREFQIQSTSGKTIRCTAIRHTSRFFSYTSWYNYLCSKHQDIIDVLK